MKNIKLLLATTAILSTTAVASFAETVPGASTSVDVDAELVEVRAIKATSDLSFGRVAYMDYSGNTSINFIGIITDENGITTVDEIGLNPQSADVETYVLTQGTRGVVKGATCNELDYPGKDSSGSTTIELDNVPTGAEGAIVSLLYCKTVENTSVFYGEFYTEPSSGKIIPGTYSGSFTVTLIADEG